MTTRTERLIYAAIVAFDLGVLALLGLWVIVAMVVGGGLAAGFAGKWMSEQ